MLLMVLVFFMIKLILLPGWFSEISNIGDIGLVYALVVMLHTLVLAAVKVRLL